MNFLQSARDTVVNETKLPFWNPHLVALPAHPQRSQLTLAKLVTEPANEMATSAALPPHRVESSSLCMTVSVVGGNSVRRLVGGR